jgi:hypothetical protein
MLSSPPLSSTPNTASEVRLPSLPLHYTPIPNLTSLIHPGNGPYLANVTGLPVTSLAPDAVANRTGGGCVDTGRFANLTVNLGPGANLTYQPHCLRRDFVPDLALAKLSQAEVDAEASATAFHEYDRNVQVRALFQV